MDFFSKYNRIFLTFLMLHSRLFKAVKGEIQKIKKIKQNSLPSALSPVFFCDSSFDSIMCCNIAANLGKNY